MPNLPSTEKGWQHLRLSLNLELASIHDHKDPMSASGISLGQYVRLQILWKERRVYKGLKLLIDDTYHNKARDTLEAQLWQMYIRSVKEHGPKIPNGAFPSIGPLAFLRHYQIQCHNTKDSVQFAPKFSPMKTRSMTSKAKGPALLEVTPSRVIWPKTEQKVLKTQDQIAEVTQTVSGLQFEESREVEEEFEPLETPQKTDKLLVLDTPAQDEVSFPAAEDEQIVNTALLMYLNALLLPFDIPLRWTPHRKAFHMRRLNKSQNPENVYEARVDGYLRLGKGADESPKIIVEVKPCVRRTLTKKIRMQESAQMAAWISSYPDTDYGDEDKFRFVIVHLIDHAFLKGEVMIISIIQKKRLHQ